MGIGCDTTALKSFTAWIRSLGGFLDELGILEPFEARCLSLWKFSWVTYISPENGRKYL